MHQINAVAFFGLNMNDFFDHNDEDESIDMLIERFETMLLEGRHYFFDVEEYEDIVDYFLSIGELDKCSIAIDYALEQYPDQSGFVIRQAQVLVSSNKAEKALNLLMRVEKIEPNNSEIYITKGAIYSQMKRYTDAIREYNKAINEEEDLAAIYSSIAYEYENMGDYHNAIIYLKKVLEIEPDNESIIFELSFCFEITYMLEESIAYFTEFTDKYPYSKFGWFNLGIALNATELFEKAIEAFEFAIAIDPTFSSAYFNKANSLAGMEHFRHAISAYRETFEYEEPEALTYYYIGECYEKLEEYDLALENFRKSVTMDENLADAWLGMGICYEELGNVKAALRFVRRALEIDPVNPDYLAALALCQQHAGFFVEAEDSYKKSIAVAVLDVEIWLDYSSLYALQDKFEEALTIIEEALVNLADEPALYFRKAAYLFMAGMDREGSKVLSEAIALAAEGLEDMFEFAPELKSHPVIMGIVEKS